MAINRPLGRSAGSLIRRHQRCRTTPVELHQIEEAALNLDAQARARLAEKLLRSLDELREDESDALWAEEAARRDAEMDRDATRGRPAEDVLRDLRARAR